MLYIALGLAGWVFLYLCLRATRIFATSEGISRVIAFLHSFAVCRYIELFILGSPLVLKDFGLATTTEESISLQFSISYFIFELVYCLYTRDEDLTMMIHHFVSLTGFLWCYNLGASGYEVCYATWLAEFTNPFLQARWYFRSKELHTTRIAQINEGLFVLLFIFFRGVVGPMYTYRIYASAGYTDAIMRYLGYALQSVSFLFLFQIFGLIKKRLFGSRAAKND